MIKATLVEGDINAEIVHVIVHLLPFTLDAETDAASFAQWFDKSRSTVEIK